MCDGCPRALAGFAVTARALAAAAFDAHPRAATAARVKRTVSECASQHDIELLGWLDCLSRLGHAEASAAGGLVALGRSCGWWWPFANIAFCSDRPSEVRTPNQGEPLDGHLGARYGGSFEYIEVLVAALDDQETAEFCADHAAGLPADISSTSWQDGRGAR